MELIISDIIEVQRKVELPESCEKCGEKFKDVGLVTYQYDSTMQTMHIGDDSYEWGSSSGAEGGYFVVQYNCGGCDHFLFENNQRQFSATPGNENVPEAPAGVKDLLNITDG